MAIQAFPGIYTFIEHLQVSKYQLWVKMGIVYLLWCKQIEAV